MVAIEPAIGKCNELSVSFENAQLNKSAESHFCSVGGNGIGAVAMRGRAWVTGEVSGDCGGFI